MKILWANADLLHPTTRGGQIRTLEMLKWLHRWHEIHYVALADPRNREGIERSREYCTRLSPVKHRTLDKRSPAFAFDLVRGALSPLPVSIFRWRSAAMRKTIADLIAREKFDCIVCDFLVSSINLPRGADCVLFQHNVETVIWERYADTASDRFRKMYFRMQARKMFAYESRVCRQARHVITVSGADAALIRNKFGISTVTPAPTGVDVNYFHPPAPAEPSVDLVFVGSMDYMANVDGVLYFVGEILPRIRKRRPGCTFTIVGRKPGPEISAIAAADPLTQVTGSVADVRPYLWGARVSVVPLRIGGGTRLKIYESMAAGVAVVSTTVGAEGLVYNQGRNIEIADDPEAFAGACVALLENTERRRNIASAACELVRNRFSWESVTREFEGVLQRNRLT
jgi:polysaccharide biosynthesis protein PslH